MQRLAHTYRQNVALRWQQARCGHSQMLHVISKSVIVATVRVSHTPSQTFPHTSNTVNSLQHVKCGIHTPMLLSDPSKPHEVLGTPYYLTGQQTGKIRQKNPGISARGLSASCTVYSRGGSWCCRRLPRQLIRRQTRQS